jgi:ATP-dependent helicase/nuclease subunit A
MNNPTDQPTRDEVLDPKFSFLVQAPAGSGKTTTLAKRILHLLAVVEDPKEIIAISFTNKAAAEMHVRVQNEYEDPENREVVNKIKVRAKENKWEQNYLKFLQIMTIDSLASKITRQTPILSRSSFMNISEDPHTLYEAAVKETMQDNGQLSELFSFLNYDYQKIEKQLIKQIETRDQWLDKVIHYADIGPKRIENEIKAYYLKEVKKWVIKLRKLFNKNQIEDIKNILSYQDSNFLHQENKIDFWLIFRDLIMTKDGKVRKRFGPKESFPKDKEGEFYKEKLLKLLEFSHINSILEDFNNVLYEENIFDIFPTKIHSACILLSELHKNLLAKFHEFGYLDYTQVIENANFALQDPGVAMLFDENISHILVDEFQDINQLQEKFLKLLTQNFSGNLNKSFFAVGDPMQSIYRFRKSDVGIFVKLQTKEKFEDVEIKTRKLEVNFRSDKKIIDWLNDIYKEAFGEINDRDKGLIEYHYSRENLETKDIEGNGVHFHILEDKTKDIFTEQHKEAEYIFETIKDIRANKENVEIAVLTRNRSHLRSLLSKMRQDHFPIEAIEIDSIEYNQAFQDIFCLTKALYNLNDRVSWVGILRAPWCGLRLEDLTCLFESNTKETPWQIINDTSITKHLTSDGQKRLTYLRKVISKNIQFRGRVAHRFFIESIWRQLFGEKILVADDIKRIDTFLDLVDQSSSPLSIDFEKLNRLVEDLHTDDQSNKDNPVKFFTIHKAKGNEFECVIIPGLGRIPKSEDHTFIAYDYDDDKQLLSLNNNKEDQDNLYNYHRSKELIRLQNEKIRLLYVAITRAKENCHLIGTVKKNSEGELSPPKNSFLKILWPQAITKDNKIKKDFKKFVPKLRRLKSKSFDREVKINTQISSIKNIKEKKISKDNIYSFTGTLIHKYYELIINKQIDIDKLLSKKLSFIYNIFVKNNFSEGEINPLIKVVKKSLLSLKNSKDGQWIYQLHEDEGMEINYLHTVNNKTEILIPDRTFIQDGTRWIIDYKTVFNDKDVKITKDYANQLDLYESLFIDDNYPIQKAIYFVAQGKLVLI